MRLFPILAAIAVSALIYVFVLERDLLTGGAADEDDATAAVSDAPEVNADAPEDGSPSLPGVVVQRSTAREIDSAVILRGQTEADRQVEVRAETSGQVISEPLRKGTFVEAGQELCRLDPGTRAASQAEARARLAEALSRLPEARAKVPEAKARVSEAMARVEEAKSRLNEARINQNAAQKLSEDGFASETRVAATEAAVRGAEAALVSAEAGLETARAGVEGAAAGIEAAKSGVESARAAVAAADREVERLTMTAPFAGLLESDTAELGALLQPGALCATVIQLDPIILVGFVPETAVARVELGARAGARLASGQRTEGTVTFLSRAADSTTRTFRVEIEVPNPDLAIRDGQTAEIIIEAEGQMAHLLPQSVLTLDDEGDLGVRVVTEAEEARFIPVTLLRDTPEGVWLAGLPDTANVIVVGQEYVTDGVRVQAAFAEAAE
ncbi:efflux RND transporter periplasmic adaptor subunit [Roseovarius sp. SCSIO 43702]|uniref:efflux RND transporter periplasmic adaptor subunit n=1 Tax=Roseovarius sp. SCSIO 43702 TaxID=2823043 RepID=UPI001C736241|nr:efflux RND transporter periplasmic adaptor subunit [Roseovarius sp. SCSIO 43702]QYX56410.1 efflux RND transporter periplasmic adaptor subunit [Roseovarius sp. SCSIO 43702]